MCNASVYIEKYGHKDKTGLFLTDKGEQLHEMCVNFKFKNFVNLPTRIAK